MPTSSPSNSQHGITDDQTEVGAVIDYDLAIAENWCIRSEIVEIIKDFLNKHLNTSHLSYNKNTSGDPELLRALSKVFNTFFDTHKEVLPAHIAVGPGASSCLDGLMQALCEPGDGVLVPTPYWNGFDFHFDIRAKVTPIPVPFDSFLDCFDPDKNERALEKAMLNSVTPVGALVVTNPHNPLGLCYSEETLLSFARFCEKHDIHFVSDEVYALCDFAVPRGLSSSNFVSSLSLDLESIGCKRSRVHMIWSMSKDLGCSGIRLGATVSQDNEKLLRRLSIPACLQVSNLAVLSSIAVLTSPNLTDLLAENRARLLECYGILAAFLESRAINYLPATAGLYIFAKLLPNDRIQDEAEFASVLKSSGITVATGLSFHTGESSRGWFRLVFSIGSEKLKKALLRLGSVVDSQMPTPGRSSTKRCHTKLEDPSPALYVSRAKKTKRGNLLSLDRKS